MRLLLCALFVFSFLSIDAQYISRSQPVPFGCPTVCPGSVIVLDIPQVQNLNNGDLVQVLLSNAAGSFASGTTVLNSTAYSTNTGTTWTLGSYTFTGNINDLYLKITIPLTQPIGSNYTIKIQSSSGYVSTDLFSCSGSNYITVTSAYATMAPVTNTAVGNAQWLAHVYTWTPTTAQQLSTPALVAAQDFFNTANYKGHFVKDSLSFNINFNTASGGSCPGAPGNQHDGTSIPCSQGYQTDFSIQMLRTENFAPGLYKLELQGDDGIRLSIDGGSTWIIGSYFEQLYSTSYKSTDSLYPTGVCLSGPTSLVIDYFQRPADSRLTFKATQLTSVSVTNPSDVTICAGQNASFSITTIPGATYQWQNSFDGGATFSSLTNNAPYTGVTTNTLNLTGVPANFNGYLYRCVISGLCGNPVNTTAATLTVSGSGTINVQPFDASPCSGSAASFHVGTTDTTVSYQWQVNTGSGFTNVTNTGVYSGATSSTLTLSSTNASMNGYQYQCVITGCGGSTITSNVATLTIGGLASITTQPVNDTVCQGANATFSVTAANASTYSWEMDNGGGFQAITASATYQNPATPQLTVVNVTPAMSGNQFRCRVADCSCNVLTVVVTLTVQSQPSITTQPASVQFCHDTAVSFQVVVSGTASSYQWQVNTGSGFANVTDGGVYSGAATSTLAISTATAAMSGYRYQCIVGGCSAPITSTAATLTIGVSNSITIQPFGISPCGGAGGAFYVGVADSAVSYQWQVNTGSGFTNVTNGGIYSGATTSTLTLSSTNVTMNGYQYQCQITGCNGVPLITNTAAVTIGGQPTINTQPLNDTVCEGASATFATSAANVSGYSWEVNTGGGFQTIAAGATYQNPNTPTLTISNVTAQMSGDLYQCRIAFCGGDTVTQSALLYVQSLASIVNQPQDVEICSDTAVSFAITTSGIATNYLWQISTDGGSTYANLVNDTSHQNVSTASMTVTHATIVNNGNMYRCVVGSCGGSVTSSPAKITYCPQSYPMYVPNAFSPNGDGVNDLFQVFTTGVKVFNLKVFDRWGELIYESDDSGTGWNGKYKGTLMEPGVYVYLLNVTFLDFTTKSVKGSLMLVR